MVLAITTHQEVEMLALDRRKSIEFIIKEEGSATVVDLAKRFDVSDQTIRRDLKVLETEGTIVVTFGGAYAREIDFPKYNIDVQVRRSLAIDEKLAIAKKAFSLLEEGDFIFIDQSTTSLTFAEEMTASKKGSKSGSVVTNSLLVADLMEKERHVTTYITGGAIDRKNACTFGEDAIESLGRYYFDKIFFTVSSASLENGLTDTNPQVCALRKKALARSKKRILLADHTKIGQTSSFFIGEIDMVDVLITDRDPGEAWVKGCEEKGIELIIAMPD